jgi:hypothetical protein
MNRLDDAMSRLAADLGRGAPLEVALEVERSVLAEFDRVQRRKRGRVWIASAGAVAASVAAVWFAENRPVEKAVAPTAVESEAERPFVPIPYVLPPDPYERVEVVRMRMPVAALIAAGFQMQTADQSAEAEADVVVGQDGRARAVRLISISTFK